jgi:uncharacterized protein
LTVQPLVHFEIHASDPGPLIAFYERVFDWKIAKWQGPTDYWLVSTRSSNIGIDGAIVPRRGPRPETGAATNAFVCTIAVGNLTDTMAEITSAKGSIVVDPVEIPGVGTVAYATDPDGNIFGVLQPSG